MASTQPQYDEQLRLLPERYPQESPDKLLRLLRRYNGDVDQVRSLIVQRQFRVNKLAFLETRFGAALTTLQQEHPTTQPLKRASLLQTMERFGGDVDYVRKYLQNIEDKQNHGEGDSKKSRHQLREELRTKYATQLAELATAGINVKCPCVLTQLEKHQGDVNKVMEIMKHRREKKANITQFDNKYSVQVAQLEADGVQVKNKRVLMTLLEKANGQVDVVKQQLAERTEKKHRVKSSSSITAEENDKSISSHKKQRHEINPDDLDHLKQLRAAGVYGNPVKILALFHECNESTEKTVARVEEERQQRERQHEEHAQKRVLLAEIHDAYLTLNNRNDWPRDIEQVYLDGNNMMFVIDCLRRLCLNRAGKKTERAIGEIAAAWNEQMRIPNVDLVYDSTRQLNQIDSIRVSSAQPSYKTTDDMLIEIARRPENQEKNKHTIIVTSDRALAALLQREGCQLVKPYSWFAHCVMVLTPDLIKHEAATDMATTTLTPTNIKARYNFDELVHRIAKIDI